MKEKSMMEDKMMPMPVEDESTETPETEQGDYSAIDAFIEALDPDELEYLKNKLSETDESPDMEEKFPKMLDGKQFED